MGLPGFWKLAAPASQTMSFADLCAIEGFEEKADDIGTMVIGVDAGLWLTQCQTVFHKPHHAQMGRNPELRTLFYKLAALNRIGVTAVFVFDGPHRPSIKRNKQVKAKPHWLVEEFSELIRLFGFHYYTAPGEADAELAYLNQRGHINGILTDDGDVALFGARRIIRRLNKEDADEITVYTSLALESCPEVGLTQGGLLLIALLSGGDYDTAGISGCGINIAHALARCGFGDDLLSAYTNNSSEDFGHFLVLWRQQLRTELRTNSCRRLKSRLPALSNSIDDTFPNLHVLELYARPETSWSANSTLPPFGSWIVRLPKLQELATYCNQKFGWSALDVVGKFKNFVFPGVYIRRLTLPLNFREQIRDHVLKGRVKDEHPHLSTYLGIIKVDSGSHSLYGRYQMKLASGALMGWALSTLDTRHSATGSPGATTIQWIPAVLVEKYFPLMVNEFNQSLPIPTSSQGANGAAVDFFDIPDMDVDRATIAEKSVEVLDLTEDQPGGESGSVARPCTSVSPVIDLTGYSSDSDDSDVMVLD